MKRKKIKKGKILKNIKIEKIGYGGIGISTFSDGKKIIIKGGVLPNTIVNCRVIKEKKDYIECQLLDYITIPQDYLKNKNNICPHNMILFSLNKKDKNNISIGCGGCKWQILPYDIQLNLKQKVFEDSFRFIYDKVKDFIKDILPSFFVNGYRNKVEFSFGDKQTITDNVNGNHRQFIFQSQTINHNQKENIIDNDCNGYNNCIGSNKESSTIKNSSEIIGISSSDIISFSSSDIINDNHQTSSSDIICLSSSDIIIGFHKQGRWDQVIDVKHCDLISEQANKIYIYFKQFVKQFDIPSYNQKEHQGILRHLVLRQGFNTSQFMLNLVIADKNDLAIKFWKNFEIFIDKLKQDEFLRLNVNTFLLTYNNGLADVVRGENIETKILRGDGYIFEKLKLNDIEATFKITPFSFFQTNTLGAQNLFSKAFEVIKLYGKRKYNFGLDLYCGTGTIGILYYKLGLFDNLIGIELIQEAIESANENAKINNIKNFYFTFGKAEKVIFEDKYLKDNLNKIDLVIVDPPRDGLHKDVVKFLLNLKRKIDFHLLYISCNPVTLARDTDLLLDKFKLRYLQPVDMFPHTHHIENIAFFV